MNRGMSKSEVVRLSTLWKINKEVVKVVKL